jgi:hypothetical protein
MDRALTTSQSVLRFLLGSYASETSMLGPLLRQIPLNATTRQVLSLGRAEQRAYFENLWRFNDEQARKGLDGAATPEGSGGRAGGRAASALYQIRRTAGLIRRFNQLPCTVGTRERRADLLVGLPEATTRILVLGDDDLLSVELARRGYAKVTVADCDEQLLGRIASETKDLETPPRIVRADFRQGFSAPEPADVVFLDPPYFLDGAQAFLRLAIQAAAPAARLYLMINPDIFGGRFGEITGTAGRQSFKVVRHRPRFNAYPIGILEASCLRIAWGLLMGRPLPRLGGRSLLFCSDCFELERG